MDFRDGRSAAAAEKLPSTSKDAVARKIFIAGSIYMRIFVEFNCQITVVECKIPRNLFIWRGVILLSHITNGGAFLSEFIGSQSQS